MRLLPKLIYWGDLYLLTLGLLVMTLMGGRSNQAMLDDITDPGPDPDMEDVVDTNNTNIRTLAQNQQRVYRFLKSDIKGLRSLLFKGIGLLVTLMVGLMGMVTAVIIL